MSEAVESLKYLFIRLWALPEECLDADEPHYVQRIDSESGIVQWTLTRDFSEANFFKKLKSAQRVVRGVQRIKSRIEHGWFYEIIHVEEEVVDSNVPARKKEKA